MQYALQNYHGSVSIVINMATVYEELQEKYDLIP